MNKHLFYLCFICLMTAFAAEPANAQKWLKDAGKGLQKAQTTGLSAAATKTTAKTAALDIKLTRLAANIQLKAFANLQLIMGVPKTTALRNTLEAGYETHRYTPRPRLIEAEAVTVSDFTQLVPLQEANAQGAMVFPFQNQRRLIYRPMSLPEDGNAIKNILENGLEINKVTRASINRILAQTATTPHIAKAMNDYRVINMTDNAHEAVIWAEKWKDKGPIRTIVAVKSPRTGKRISFDTDIPPADIYAVAAYLHVNGQDRWCKVEPAGDGFRVTPYEPFAE